MTALLPVAVLGLLVIVVGWFFVEKERRASEHQAKQEPRGPATMGR